MDDQNSSSGISFPSVSEPQRKGNGARTLLIAGILILIGILGFVIFKSASKKSEVISIETSDDELSTPTTQATASPAPSSTPLSSSTPKASSRSLVAIEIQNGTGITGEAAYLQNQLKALGYTKINVGNASSQDATTTTVTFSKSLASDLVDELTKKLQSIYQDVSVKTSATQLGDVIIVTGVRKGATSSTSSPKASLTPTPKSTVKPSSTPTSTP